MIISYKINDLQAFDKVNMEKSTVTCQISKTTTRQIICSGHKPPPGNLNPSSRAFSGSTVSMRRFPGTATTSGILH